MVCGLKLDRAYYWKDFSVRFELRECFFFLALEEGGGGVGGGGVGVIFIPYRPCRGQGEVRAKGVLGQDYFLSCSLGKKIF